MQARAHSAGQLNRGITDNTLVERTLDFIWASLVPWRDDPERFYADSEEELNGQFHDFIDAKARNEFPMVYFRHEQRQTGIRRVDLAAKPVQSVQIESVTYTKYEPILVIEGKRLPAPSPKTREKEYVTGGEKTSGGIQRFKLGLHGKDHQLALLIGYLQKKTPKHWLSTVNGWISDLAEMDTDSWSLDETLDECPEVMTLDAGKSVSVHPRCGNCVSPNIRLFHFWVQMSSKSDRTSGES
jgi:hypothetical protein